MFTSKRGNKRRVNEPRLEVLERTDLRWSSGAPSPLLLSSEERTLFAFDVADDPAHHDEPTRAVGELLGCLSVRFGSPGDETQHGHAFAPAGLKYYALHEVHGSAWITELRQIASIHERAAEVPHSSARHFVLTFHDSMLEAVATDVVRLATFQTDQAAVTFMVEQLRG